MTEHYSRFCDARRRLTAKLARAVSNGSGGRIRRIPGGIYHKAAIIDRAIAWEGNMNILQHWNTQEQMTRHEDPEYIKQLINVLGIK